MSTTAMDVTVCVGSDSRERTDSDRSESSESTEPIKPTTAHRSAAAGAGAGDSTGSGSGYTATLGAFGYGSASLSTSRTADIAAEPLRLTIPQATFDEKCLFRVREVERAQRNTWRCAVVAVVVLAAINVLTLFAFVVAVMTLAGVVQQTVPNGAVTLDSLSPQLALLLYDMNRTAADADKTSANSGAAFGDGLTSMNHTVSVSVDGESLTVTSGGAVAIAVAGVTADKLAPAAVTSTAIANGSVHQRHLAADALITAGAGLVISDGEMSVSFDTNSLQTENGVLSVIPRMIATANLADGAIIATKIGAGAVNFTHLSSPLQAIFNQGNVNGVTTAQLNAAIPVAGSGLTTASNGQSNVFSVAVDNQTLTVNAANTLAIRASAVTAQLLAANAVETSAVSNGSIVMRHLNSDVLNVLTPFVPASGLSIGAGRALSVAIDNTTIVISNNSLTAVTPLIGTSRLLDNAVTAAKLASFSVNTSALALGAVRMQNIGADVVSLLNSINAAAVAANVNVTALAAQQARAGVGLAVASDGVTWSLAANISNLLALFNPETSQSAIAAGEVVVGAADTDFVLARPMAIANGAATNTVVRSQNGGAVTLSNFAETAALTVNDDEAGSVQVTAATVTINAALRLAPNTIQVTPQNALVNVDFASINASVLLVSGTSNGAAQVVTFGCDDAHIGTSVSVYNQMSSDTLTLAAPMCAAFDWIISASQRVTIVCAGANAALDCSRSEAATGGVSVPSSFVNTSGSVTSNTLVASASTSTERGAVRISFFAASVVTAISLTLSSPMLSSTSPGVILTTRRGGVGVYAALTPAWIVTNQTVSSGAVLIQLEPAGSYSLADGAQSLEFNYIIIA